MDWQLLRDKIYYLDGSLRDIIVRNTNRNDWLLRIDFVNSNYQIEFTVDGSDDILNQIDKEIVFNNFDSPDKTLNCSVYLGQIILKCYFFHGEIENDITPREINTLDDHNNLVEYLVKISTLLNKRVILCDEGFTENRTELIVADNGHITIHIE